MLTNKNCSLKEEATKNSQMTLEQTNIKCNFEVTAIKTAMEANDIENVRVLLLSSRVGWKTRRAIFQREIFHLIASNNLKSARLYLEHLPNWNIIDENFAISLRLLFEQGSHEVVRMMLQCKIDEYARLKFGMELLVNAFANKNVNLVELMELRGSFDVNTQDASGETALHLAVENDAVDNVKYLLDHGANPNLQDCVGWTAMFVVKSVKCMGVLLDFGADLQCLDKDGYTIFDTLEASNYEMMKATLASLVVEEAKGTILRRVVRERIAEKKTFRTFYEKCQREIEGIRGSNELLFSVLCESTNNLVDFFSSEQMVRSVLNGMINDNGYVYFMVKKKLNEVLNVIELREKECKVYEKINDTCDFYQDIAGRKIDRSIFEDLLMFLLIIFVSIRILF